MQARRNSVMQRRNSFMHAGAKERLREEAEQNHKADQPGVDEVLLPNIPDPGRRTSRASNRPGSADARPGTANTGLTDTSKRSQEKAYKVAQEIAAERKRKEEEEKKRIAEYDLKVKMRDKGSKATEIYKALKTDPRDFKGLRKLVHELISWWGFDTAIGVIIMANAITIGFETQAKSSLPLGCTDACICTERFERGLAPEACTVPPAWTAIADYVFYGVYVVELLLRVGVYGVLVFKSGWVKFDCFLVVTASCDMIIKAVDSSAVLDEFNIFMLVRMLRLARLARAVRLMVQFKTLWQLVQGLWHSKGTLLWTFLLISILMYVGAVMGMELIRLDPDLELDHPFNIAAGNHFRDFFDAVLTLLQVFSLDSIGIIYKPLIKHQFYLLLYFMSFLLLLSIALMNLVTAVMVNSSLDQATQDKEALKAWESARRAKQIDHLKDMFLTLDEDGSGELTLDEINNAPEETQQQLKEIVATDDLKELFDMLDYDGGGTIGVEEFCDGILKATTRSTGILELGRLVKQCSDTLQNSREAITILCKSDFKAFLQRRSGNLDGSDDGDGGTGGDGGSGGGRMARQVSPAASSGVGSSRPPSAVRKGSKEKRQGRDNFPASLSSLAAVETLVKEEDLDRLDSKVTKMEADLGSMHSDIQRVIQMMNDKIARSRSGGSRNTSPNTSTFRNSSPNTSTQFRSTSEAPRPHSNFP
eukprot:s784_g13.t1